MEEEKHEKINNHDEDKDLISPEAKIDRLKQELEEERNRHLRTLADFENFRKRTERDAEATRVHIKKDILLDLLTFLDYFDQASKQVQDPAAARGIDIMARQFNDLLQKHGARQVQCLGEPFDPEEQEGIGYVTTSKVPEGCVAEEICAGWKLGDLLLKPAQVMVEREKDKDNNAHFGQTESGKQELE